MARKGITKRTKYTAKLVTDNKAPCAFCKREVDDEVIYGKLYAIGDIQCHYFCVLLSCCLIQKGKDHEGLFGFMYSDILAEIERSKKHKCSYCGKEGATLGCSISRCRKQFHLPCGRERDAVSMFYGNYKSFCQKHAPKQTVPDNILNKIKARRQEKKGKSKQSNNKEENIETNKEETLGAESVCVICYEEVDASPSVQTFWPPCCARDAWFHRHCLQHMALTAGLHYLKCPLCNDKSDFHKAVVSQGYYIPNRDAAWELEQNAFADMYERPLLCNVTKCHCPLGRNHDSDAGEWDIKLCLLCGSVCGHAYCLSPELVGARYVCDSCKPAAPENIDELANQLEAVIAIEQSTSSQPNRPRRGPVMPSRMSLRRTKRVLNQSIPSSSRHQSSKTLRTDTSNIPTHTEVSRMELNINSPKDLPNNNGYAQKLDSPKKILKTNMEAIVMMDSIFSPENMFEQYLKEKIGASDSNETENVLLNDVMERLRQKIKKPKPLSEKKKIVDGILNDILSKTKQPIEDTTKVQEISTPEKSVHTDVQEEISREENENNTIPQSRTFNTEDDSSTSTFELPPEFVAAPSDDSLSALDTPNKLKTVDIQKDSSMEISADNDVVNVDLVTIENASTKDSVQLSTPKKCHSEKSKRKRKLNSDIENFENRYLNEVDRDFKCDFEQKHLDKSNTSVLSTATDFAKNASESKKKKKLKNKKSLKKNRPKIVLQYNDTDSDCDKSNVNASVSIRNEDMQVKIRLKKERFRLKIMQAKSSSKTLKQYVLKCNDSSNEVIEKPGKDVTLRKRRYIKQEKSPDNYKQMSLHSFFKPKTSES